MSDKSLRGSDLLEAVRRFDIIQSKTVEEIDRWGEKKGAGAGSGANWQKLPGEMDKR